jgi:hypothetical protein
LGCRNGFLLRHLNPNIKLFRLAGTGGKSNFQHLAQFV